MNIIFKIISMICISSVTINCAKIIVLQPMGSKSHLNVFSPLIHELAARGHEVTWISCFPQQKPVPNIRHIFIPENGPLLEGGENQKALFQTAVTKSPWGHMETFFRIMINSTKNFVDNPEIESLIQKGVRYDVAIVSAFLNDISLMVSKMLANHTVAFSPAAFPAPSKGTPPCPSSVVPFLPYPSEMNFWQRMTNAVLLTLMWPYFQYHSAITSTVYGREKYPDLSSAAEVLDRVSLYLVNADPVMAAGQPDLPNFIRVGGLQCKQPQPLPKIFSDFVESSGDEGFILFSLGSIVQAKNMPENIRREFLKAFSQLKQKVIWKFEVEMPNIPSNVMITPWTPQQDLLGHPKIRLFFTHGGLLSCQEAIYHGVPVLGLAVFADQPMNIFRLTELGIGEELNIGNISAKDVKSKIENIIQNSSYKLNMKKYSEVFRDQTEHPLDRAVFWIEHLLRHKSDDYFKTPAVHLENHQYLSLDIISVLIFFPVVIMWTITKILKRLMN